MTWASRDDNALNGIGRMVHAKSNGYDIPETYTIQRQRVNGILTDMHVHTERQDRRKYKRTVAQKRKLPADVNGLTSAQSADDDVTDIENLKKQRRI